MEKSPEDHAEKHRYSQEQKKRRGSQRGRFQALPYQEAYDEPGAGIVAERKQVACFRKADPSFTQKICRDLAAHRIAAQKSGQHGKRAIGGYPEKPSENRGQKPGQHPRRICTDEEIRDDQEGKKRGKNGPEPEKQTVFSSSEYRLWKEKEQQEKQEGRQGIQEPFHFFDPPVRFLFQFYGEG